MTTVSARSYPGCPESVAAARAWVASFLPGCPALDDVVLCASELITNSVRYSRSGLPGGELTVRVEVTAGSALVDVVDQGPAMPGGASAHGLGAGWQIIRELAGFCGREGPRAWFVATWQGCGGCVGRGTGSRCCACGGWIAPDLRRRPGDPSEYQPACPDCRRGAVHAHGGLRLVSGGVR